MPGPLYHVGATGSCPHQGIMQTVAAQAKVLVGGQPVCTLSDGGTVAACVFIVPPSKPQPCLRVQWMMGATKVTILGQPPLLQTSAGLCLSAEQLPQGPPMIRTTQTKVTGA